MRRVFTSASDVIHLFAQQSQDSARCTNVFFEKNTWRDSEFGNSVDYGTKIYSYGYHFLLAEFLSSDTIMINDSRTSVTTSKHAREVISGTRQYTQFFKSDTDLDSVLYQVQSHYKNLATARKPEKYINPIIETFNKLNEYIEWTKKNKCYKKTLSDKRYREIKKIYNRVTGEDLSVTIEQLKVYDKKQKDAKKKREAKELKEKLEKFNSFEINSFTVGDEDYLRLNTESGRVETSQNVKVSIEDSKLLYLAIKAGKDIKGHKIGYYTVNSLNGVLTIGCHRINMESVHSVGEQILSL